MMGMTEFSASLAPRSQMNSTFLPFKPMVPSARAFFTTSGTSIKVPNATAAPVLKLRSRKDRRVRTFRVDLLFCISSLLLESLEGHQHGDHAAHAQVVSAGGRGADREVGEQGGGAVVGRVEKVHGRRPVQIEIGSSFPGEEVTDKQVSQSA